MTNAFSSVLSLKRNRSTSTSKAHSVGSSEPVSKLSRLKSGLNIFSKLSDALTQHQHQHQQDNQRFTNYTKRTSFIGILQYFRNDQDTRNKSRLRRKATYDSDGYYEYHQYHQYHQKLNRKQTDARQVERNIHTLPTPQAKKLTSILIKRSGTNPVSQPSQRQQQQQQHLTKVSSRRSNATHVSASNITVNSEDLTAKEFADIAGIRILPEDDIGEEQEERYDDDPDNLVAIERKLSSGTSTNDDDIHMHTVSTASKSYLDYLDEHHRLSVISYVSLQSYSTSSKPKIWDNEFWLNPDEQHHHYQQCRISRSNSAATHRSNHTASNESTTAKKRLDRKPSTTVVVVEPPILHELRTRNSDKKADQNSHCVIKKGRFEIHLGDASDHIHHHHSDQQTTTTTTTITTTTAAAAAGTNESVVEWKRKRKD
ncbi:hypothetical protein MBANPS3_006109 [Mucor bainieri]